MVILIMSQKSKILFQILNKYKITSSLYNLDVKLIILVIMDIYDN